MVRVNDFAGKEELCFFWRGVQPFGLPSDSTQKPLWRRSARGL